VTSWCNPRPSLEAKFVFDTLRSPTFLRRCVGCRSGTAQQRSGTPWTWWNFCDESSRRPHTCTSCWQAAASPLPTRSPSRSEARRFVPSSLPHLNPPPRNVCMDLQTLVLMRPGAANADGGADATNSR